MSFTDKGSAGNEAPADLVRISHASAANADRPHGLTLAEAYSLPSEPAELTAADIRKLRLEGRRAAFEGRSQARCPYGLAEQAARRAWLSGYNGER
ncbi:Rmf/CrpP family protein [Rhizobium sp. YIM 134829]|uniref:ribosome modulation factor n=1 Tax=Rhizobium sp. YIM 134829 TaxID=3390453 RepID=UPI00397C69E2